MEARASGAVAGGSPAPARPSGGTPDAWVLDTPRAVRAAADLWPELGVSHPHAQPDFLLEVCAQRDEVVSPYVLVLARGGAPAGLAVGRLEDIRLRTRLGYREVYRPRVRSLSIVAGGLVGRDAERDQPALVALVARALRLGEADVAGIPGITVGTPAFEAARRTPGRLARPLAPAPAPRWSVALPDSPDEFLAARSSSWRQQLRRKQRRLSERYGDALQTNVLREPGDLDRVLDDLERVSAGTYKRGLGVGFERTPEQRALVRLGLERGSYRAWVMSIEGRPRAFVDGYAQGDTFWLGTLAHDPDEEQRPLSIGTLLLARAFADLCGEPALHRFDFGSGDADYKRRFGDESHAEADLAMFAPRPRPVAVNVVRSSLLAGARGARRLLGGDRTRRLKRAWRERLARKARAG
ncbi:MAG: GNAT family N-acetyltransferase [Solirubrobacteraceae bacterium]